MPGRYKKISGADMIDDDRDVYRRPYLILFNGMTDARMALERGDPALAKDLLRRAQEDAEDALSAGKETWQEQLATVTAERDELSVSNAALQAQAEEAANALAQAQTQQESLEASLTEAQAAATAAESICPGSPRSL